MVISESEFKSKDPGFDPLVVWSHRNTAYIRLSNYLSLGSATLLKLAFLGKSEPNFPCEKFPMRQQSKKKKRLLPEYGIKSGTPGS